MKKETFIKILRATGTPDSTIAEVEANWEKDDYAPDTAAITKATKDHWKQLVLDDPTVIEKLESDADAKHKDMARRNIRQAFDLSPEEIKDKNLKEICDLAKAKYMENTDKSAQTLSEENMALKAKIKEYDDVTIPAVRAEVDQKLDRIDLDKKIQEITGNQDEFKYRNTYSSVYRAGMAELSESYDIKKGDAGEPVLIDKKTGQRAKNADGTKYVDFKDKWKEIMEAGSFLTKSNSEEKGPGTGHETEVKTAEQLKKDQEALKNVDHATSNGLSKAEKHLAEMKSDPLVKK
jgi:hypothetical protein